MSSSTDYVNYILEQLSCAGLARARRMFGEYGLYLDGMFFAVICDDELFIKPTQAALAAFPELPWPRPMRARRTTYAWRTRTMPRRSAPWRA